MSDPQYLLTEKTWICENCGQEVNRGLMFACDHWTACKHDAPNENIAAHWREVEMNKRQKVYEEKWGIVYGKMTVKERETDWWNSMCGTYNPADNSVMMGTKAFKRMKNFRDEMRIKYAHKKGTA